MEKVTIVDKQGRNRLVRPKEAALLVDRLKTHTYLTRDMAGATHGSVPKPAPAKPVVENVPPPVNPTPVVESLPDPNVQTPVVENVPNGNVDVTTPAAPVDPTHPENGTIPETSQTNAVTTEEARKRRADAKAARNQRG